MVSRDIVTRPTSKIAPQEKLQNKENVASRINTMPHSMRITNKILCEKGADDVQQVAQGSLTMLIPWGTIIILPRNQQHVQNVNLNTTSVCGQTIEGQQLKVGNAGEVVVPNENENQPEETETGPERNVSCAYPGCSRVFAHVKSADRHFQVCHIRGKRYPCNFPNCGRTFALARHLQVHMCVHTGEKPHVCDYPGCEKKFMWKTGLYKHRIVHMETKPFACSVDGCGRGFFNQRALELHGLKHSKEKPFVCPFNCGMAFSENRYLTLHKRKRHEEMRFACSYPDCARKFHSAATRLLHVRRVHTGEKPFRCEFEGCERRFVTTKERKAHFVALHTGEKPFECKVAECGKKFSTSSGLSSHKRSHRISSSVETDGMSAHVKNVVRRNRHSTDKPGEYACDFPGCNKKFVWRTGFYKHRIVHMGKKPFECTVEGCSKGFIYKRELEQHVLTHSIDKPFVCPFKCGKAFSRTCYLDIHKRKEHEENRFPCTDPNCGLKFFSSSICLEHVRRVHTGEKPYQCPFEGCDSRFVTAKERKAHWITHTGEKPFVCKVAGCGKKYSASSTLSTHVKKCHKTARNVEVDGIFFEVSEMNEELMAL